ncbi:hypothetical protein MRX96_058720 [Rhipicephalus microplus]
MKEDRGAEDCAAKQESTKMAPPTAADFLKAVQAEAPTQKAKKKSMKGKKATYQHQAPVTQAAADSPPFPAYLPLSYQAANGSKATSPTFPAAPAEKDFKKVCSKAASHIARKLPPAALPMDTAVVGTVLLKLSSPSGSF